MNAMQSALPVASQSWQWISGVLDPIQEALMPLADKIIAFIGTVFSQIGQLFQFHVKCIKNPSSGSFGTGVSKCPVMIAQRFFRSAAV